MSEALRRVFAADEPAQYAATLHGSDGEFLLVDTDAGPRPARRAAGCLLRPEVGDRVLVARADDERWVLAVLTRADASRPAAIDATGDLELRAMSGCVRTVARDGVAVVTTGEAAVTAGAVRVNARDGSLVLERASALLGVVEAEAERLKGSYGFLDTVAERVTQRAKRVYRFVEELEQLRAGRVSLHAKGTVQVHAHDTLMTSEQLVKIDGATIQLG